MNREIFERLNLTRNNDISLEGTRDYLEKIVKDANWKKVLVDSLYLCNREMDEYSERLQRQSNFTKDVCNTKFSTVVDCIQIDSFFVS